MKIDGVRWSPAAADGDFKAIIRDAMAATDEQLKDSLAAETVGPLLIQACMSTQRRIYTIQDRMKRVLTEVIRLRLYGPTYPDNELDDLVRRLARDEDFEPADPHAVRYFHVRIEAVDRRIESVRVYRKFIDPEVTVTAAAGVLAHLPLTVTEQPVLRREAEDLAAKLAGSMAVEIVEASA